MTSDRQAAANRANARRSTGPRSAAGKATSRLNATRHGLSTSAAALPEFAADVVRLIQVIAGDEGDPAVREAAARIAGAAIDIARIRRLRAEITARILAEPELPPIPRPSREPLPRFSGRAFKEAFLQASQNDASFDLPNWFSGYTQESLNAGRVAEQKRQRSADARRAAQESHRQRAADWAQLQALERYERRALSRRASAINALDDVLAARARP